VRLGFNFPKRYLHGFILILCVALSAVLPAHAAEEGGHSDTISPVLLALMAILAVAKLGGELFERLGLPAVLGELVGGMILGNLVLINPHWGFFEPLRVMPIQTHWAVTIDALAQLGVIVLLFEVGLQSTVGDMRKVGASSLLVAVLGVIAPLFLGYGVSWLFIKQIPSPLRQIVHQAPRLL
jgi:Kef-type K+ transport system membrane component KefB